MCDLQQITEDWISVFKGLLNSGVDLSVHTNQPIPELWLDRWQYQNCLLNLVNNAQDAITDEGNIVIELSLQKEYVVVSCSDDGEGIDASLIEQIKEPHFTTKSDAGGTGLGLYMIDNFCKQFGGYVVIESQPGAGTQVYMHLPVLRQEH